MFGSGLAQGGGGGLMYGGTGGRGGRGTGAAGRGSQPSGRGRGQFYPQQHQQQQFQPQFQQQQQFQPQQQQRQAPMATGFQQRGGRGGRGRTSGRGGHMQQMQTEPSAGMAVDSAPMFGQQLQHMQQPRQPRGGMSSSRGRGTGRAVGGRAPAFGQPTAGVFGGAQTQQQPAWGQGAPVFGQGAQSAGPATGGFQQGGFQQGGPPAFGGHAGAAVHAQNQAQQGYQQAPAVRGGRESATRGRGRGRAGMQPQQYQQQPAGGQFGAQHPQQQQPRQAGSAAYGQEAVYPGARVWVRDQSQDDSQPPPQQQQEQRQTQQFHQQQQQQPAFGRSTRGGRGGRFGAGRGGSSGGRSSPRGAGYGGEVSSPQFEASQDSWQHDQFQDAGYPPTTPSAPGRRGGKPLQLRQPMPEFEEQSPRTPFQPRGKTSPREAFTPDAQQFSPSWQEGTPDMRTPGAVRSTGRSRTLQGSTVSARFAPPEAEFGYDASPQTGFVGNQAMTFHTPPTRPKKTHAQQAAMQQPTPSPQPSQVWSSEHGMRASTPKQRQQRPRGRQPAPDQAASPAEAFEPSGTPSSQHDSWGHDMYEAEAPTSTQRRSRKAAATPGEQRRKPVSIAHAAAYDEADEERNTALALFPSPDGKNQETRPPKQKQPRGKQQQQQQQRDKAAERPRAKPGKQALLDRPMPSRGQMKAPPPRSAEEEEDAEQQQLSDSEPAAKLPAQKRGGSKAPAPSSTASSAAAAAPAGSAPMASYGALSTFLKKDYQPPKQASAAAATTSKPDSEQLSTKPYARKPAKLSDWIAPVDVKKSFADASAMAQCQDMCAERERIRRAAENDLHKLEQEHPDLPGLTLADMAIKKYQRSAADHELKIPSEIRPAPVLLRTLEYIEDELMEKDVDGPDPRYGGEPVPSLELYLFIWDRFRMICKDFILQDYRFGGLNDQCCIEVHERIARWYVMMDHQMRADPEFVKAHAQQNAEQLNAVLKSLGSFYDDARKRGPDVAAEWCKHEAEFRSYFLLYQLDNKDVTQAALAMLAPEVLAAPAIQLVLQVMKARKYRNYARFFRVFKEADYLHACILFKYVGVMRAEALRLLSRFFLAPKTKTRYPLDELIDLLCFEDEDDAMDFLESFGLYIDTSGEEAALLLEGVNLQHATPPATRFMENWIEGRLVIDEDTRFSRKQVCHGLAKQELVAAEEGTQEEEEEEEAEAEEEEEAEAEAAEQEEEEEEEPELKAVDTAAAKTSTTTPVVKRSVSKDDAAFSAMSTPTPSSRRSGQPEVQLTPISPLEFSTPRSTTVPFPDASFPPNIPKSAIFSIGTSDRPDAGLVSPKMDTPTTPLAARDTASPFPMLQKQPSVEAVKPVALRPATAEFSRAILRDEQLSPSKEAESTAAVSKPAKVTAEADKAAAIKRGEKLLSLAKRVQLRRALRQWAEYVQSRRQELRRCLLTMWFWRWHHLMQLEIERKERHASSLAALEMPPLEPSRRKRQASFDADQAPQVKRGQLLVVPHAEIEPPQAFEPVHLAAPDWLYARAVGWSSAEPMRGCVPLPLAQIVAPMLYKTQLAAVWQLQEQFGQALNTDEIDWRAKLCWKLLVGSSARFSGQWDSRSSQSVASVVRALLANQDMESEHAPSTEWIGYWEENALVQGRGYNAVARPVAVSVRDCASDYRDANDLGAILLGSQGVLFICSDWVLDHAGDADPAKHQQHQQQQAEDIDVFGGLLDDLAELGVDLTVLPIHVLVVGTGRETCVRELTEQEQSYFESAIDLSMLPQPTYSVVLVAESELHDLDSVGSEEHPGWCLPDALLSGVLDALRALAARSPHAPLVERHNICGWLWKLVEQVLVQHVPRTDDIAVEDYVSLALFEVASLIEKCERQVRRHIEQPEAFHYPALDFAIDIPAAVEPEFESDVHGSSEPTFPAVLGALWAEKSQASNFVPVYWNDDKHACSDELLFALQALTPVEWSSAVADAHEVVAGEYEYDDRDLDDSERAALAARVRLQSYLAQLKSMGWTVATECVELLLEACSSNDLSVARQGLLCMFSARLTQMAASYDRTGYLPAETWAVPRPDPEHWRPALQQLPQQRQRKAAALLEDEEEEKQNDAAVVEAVAAAAVITPSKPRGPKRRRVPSAHTPRLEASRPAAAAAASASEVVVLDHDLPDYDDSDAVETPAVPRIVHELQHETEEQRQLNAWLQAQLAMSLDSFAPPACELPPPPPQPTPRKRSKRPLPPSSPSPSLPLTGGVTTEYLAALEKERKEFDEMMRRLKRGYTLPEPSSTSEKPATDTEDNSDEDRDHGDDLIGEWLGSLLREGRELQQNSEQLHA